jgi:hypothetical protein
LGVFAGLVSERSGTSDEWSVTPDKGYVVSL